MNAMPNQFEFCLSSVHNRELLRHYFVSVTDYTGCAFLYSLVSRSSCHLGYFGSYKHFLLDDTQKTSVTLAVDLNSETNH